MPLRVGAATPVLRVGTTPVKKAYRGGSEVFSADLGVGGVLSVEIGADGWYADLTFKGQATGGTYDFGLGADFNPDTGSPKLVLTVTSLGFDDTGAATTVTRTVYGTRFVRKPYPNHAQAEESAFGTADVKVRVALSEYVYAKDKAGTGNSGTNVAVTVGAGLYTAGGTPSLGGSLTATNSSTAAYPKVVGNWSWPGLDKVGATITPRFVAFQRHARNGRPVRAVRFTATGDTSAATVTQTVTAMTVDGTVGDAVPVPEYVGSLSTAALTQGENVTLRAEVFPWVGDATSTLDTSAGTAGPTPLYGPIKVVCDKAGTYATSYAVVDPVGGNDTTGTVRQGTVDATLPFATIAAAYTALRTFNNTTYARNNGGGSTIYLRTGSHAWIGAASVTVGTTPDAWMDVQGYPGDAASGVLIATQTSTTAASKTLTSKLRLRDLTITQQSANGTLQVGTGGYLWLDRVTVNQPTASQPLFTQSTAAVWYVTRCTITAMTQGLRPFSTNPVPCALARGNEITAVGGTAVGTGALLYTFIGNRKITTNGNLAATTGISGQTAPATANIVVAYNRLTVGLVSSPILSVKNQVVTESEAHGIALVQNILENTVNGSTPLLQIAADASTGSPVDNVMVWHNVAVGQRCNFGYNEVAPAAPAGNTFDAALVAHRRMWSVKNNICDDMNTKHDVFEGSGYAANGGKVGGWPVLYGVGHSGNVFAETTGIGAPGQFAHHVPGLKSRQGTGALTQDGTGGVNATATAAGYLQFVSRASFDGTAAGTGNGDYRLQSGSPAKGMARDWLLPFDIAGTARTAATDPGVYA